MLNTLFSDTKSSNEIKEVLEKNYEVPMNRDYGKEIELMCNLSGRIEEKSLQQGIQQGLEQGMQQGLAMEFLQSIERIKETLKVPLEEALRVLGKTMEEYTEAQKLLR